jgi:hypothetical protein
MATDSSNIIIGAATVSIGGVDVGHTFGGVTVRYVPTFIEVESDQAVGIARKGRSLERMYVTTTLLEVTLENLRKAMMQPLANLAGTSVLTLGYNNACWVDEHQIILTGPGPNCGTRIFTLSKCVSMGESEYQMQRTQEVRFAVEFECLKDDNGEFGTIYDV